LNVTHKKRYKLYIQGVSRGICVTRPQCVKDPPLTSFNSAFVSWYKDIRHQIRKGLRIEYMYIYIQGDSKRWTQIRKSIFQN